MIEVFMLAGGVGLALYLLWNFLTSEKERKRKMKAQDEFFERRMTEIASDPSDDPNNFVISLRPCEEFPELCIDVEESVREEDEISEDLNRTHNGFGHEWSRGSS